MMNHSHIKNRTINVLHVSHSWGGGINFYINDIVKATAGSCNHFVLSSFGNKLAVEYSSNGLRKKSVYHLSKKLQLSDFYDKEYSETISLILKAYDLDIVHISSCVGHTFDIFKIPKLMKIPIVYTIHDFFHICPTCHLVEKNGSYCGICRHGEEKVNCLDAHPYLYSEFNGKMLRNWRNEFSNVKNYIDLFIFPSNSAKNIFSNYFNISEGVGRVVCHGFSLNEMDGRKETDLNKGLRVGILGTMMKHKGRHLAASILKNIGDDEIEFVHFGDKYLKSKNLINYGRYARSDILNLIRDYKIDVTLILSTWPETFSYTLSESIAAHVPAIVTNFGALKERVESNGIGWVVDYNDIEKICNLLVELKNNKKEIEKRAKKIALLDLKTVEEMKDDYLKIYKSMKLKNGVTDSTEYNNQYYMRRLEKKFGQKHKHILKYYKKINISDFIFKVNRKLNDWFL